MGTVRNRSASRRSRVEQIYLLSRKPEEGVWGSKSDTKFDPHDLTRPEFMNDYMDVYLEDIEPPPVSAAVGVKVEFAIRTYPHDSKPTITWGWGRPTSRQ